MRKNLAVKIAKELILANPTEINRAGVTLTPPAAKNQQNSLLLHNHGFTFRN